MPKIAKSRGTPTRTARLSLYILDWRCSLTQYVTGQHARKLGHPKARFTEDTGIESSKLGPKMLKTAKKHGTPTRTARFSLDILDWRCFLTRYVRANMPETWGTRKQGLLKIQASKVRDLGPQRPKPQKTMEHQPELHGSHFIS